MYSKITNPKTSRQVSINSRLGKQILKKYLSVLYGGTVRNIPRDCSKIIKNQIAMGSFKRLFSLDCSKNEAKDIENCHNKVIALCRKDKECESDVKWQKQLDPTSLHSYGKCNKSFTTKLPNRLLVNYYKIEEKYDLNLENYIKTFIEPQFIGRDDKLVMPEPSIKENLFKLFIYIRDHLHSANLAHYDIKPDNIMIKNSGNVITDMKLIDFGGVGSFPKGLETGTPDYMEPLNVLYLATIAWVGIYNYVYYGCGNDPDYLASLKISNSQVREAKNSVIPDPTAIQIQRTLRGKFGRDKVQKTKKIARDVANINRLVKPFTFESSPAEAWKKFCAEKISSGGASSSMTGTPVSPAPSDNEAYNKENKMVSDKSDIWALGLVIWKLYFEKDQKKSIGYSPTLVEKWQQTDLGVAVSKLTNKSKRISWKNSFSSALKAYNSPGGNSIQILYLLKDLFGLDLGEDELTNDTTEEEWMLRIRPELYNQIKTAIEAEPEDPFAENPSENIEYFNNLVDLLYNMLKLHKHERFDIEQVIAHPFFDDVRPVADIATGAKKAT